MKTTISAVMMILIILSGSITQPVSSNSHLVEGDNGTYLPLIYGGCSSPINPLINSDFESGKIGWTFSVDNSGISTGKYEITPHGGNSMAVINSNGEIPGISPGAIEQSFTVPDCPFFNFWWASYMQCSLLNEPPFYGWIVVTVNGKGVASFLKEMDQVSGTNPWGLAIVDLSAYRGNTITLRITAFSSRDHIEAFIDDVGF